MKRRLKSRLFIYLKYNWWKMKILICLLLLICSNFTKLISSETEMVKFKKGDFAKINKEYPDSYYINKIVKIKSIVDLSSAHIDDWRIDWVLKNLKANQSCSGKIFFVECENLEYTMHESWLEEVDQASAEKIYLEENIKNKSCIIL